MQGRSAPRWGARLRVLPRYGAAGLKDSSTCEKFTFPQFTISRRIGRVLKKRDENIDDALALLDKDTVMSWAEARRVAEIKGEKVSDEVEGTTADVA